MEAAIEMDTKLTILVGEIIDVCMGKINIPECFKNMLTLLVKIFLMDARKHYLQSLLLLL